MGMDYGVASLIRLAIGTIKLVLKVSIGAIKLTVRGVAKGVAYLSRKNKEKDLQATEPKQEQEVEKYPLDRYRIVVAESEDVEKDGVYICLDNEYSKSLAIEKCCQIVMDGEGYLKGQVIEKNKNLVVYEVDNGKQPMTSTLEFIQNKVIESEKQVSQEVPARKNECEI